MFHRLAVVVAAALGAALLPGCATAADTDEPARVLIVGDSVTQGLDGDYTWRYFAARELGSRVDLVGNHNGTLTPGAVNDWGGTYADPAFDTDHAARWGMALWEMQNTPSTTTPQIRDLVAAYRPDVVVEQLGVNDLDRVGLTADEMVGQVRTFVAEARAAKPDVDVVLGSLPQTWIGDAAAYNAALPSLAAELSTNASRVTATATAPWTRGVDTYDFAHPTTSGQEKLAAVVVDALAPLLPAPAPETVSPVVEPVAAADAPAPSAPVIAAPGAPRKVKALRDGRKARLVWRSVAGAERYVARCGRAQATVEKVRAVVRTGAATCKVRAVNVAGASPWAKARVR